VLSARQIAVIDALWRYRLFFGSLRLYFDARYARHFVLEEGFSLVFTNPSVENACIDDTCVSDTYVSNTYADRAFLLNLGGVVRGCL
jgi:hypothetical protein